MITAFDLRQPKKPMSRRQKGAWLFWCLCWCFALAALLTRFVLDRYELAELKSRVLELRAQSVELDARLSQVRERGELLRRRAKEGWIDSLAELTALLPSTMTVHRYRGSDQGEELVLRGQGDTSALEAAGWEFVAQEEGAEVKLWRFVRKTSPSSQGG